MEKFVHITQLRVHPIELGKRGTVASYIPSVEGGLFFVSIKAQNIGKR